MSFQVTFVLGDFTHFGVPYNGSFAHGIASMTAVLRQNGYSVSLLHLTRPPSKARFREQLLATEPNLVAFSTITHLFPYVQQWAAWGREACRAPIIVGGVHSILSPEEVIATPAVDFVCSGEGEAALLDLCDALREGRDASGIPGIWSKRGGEVTRNPQRPLAPDINKLPIPDYSVFDFERINAGRDKKVLSVMVSRGCPYRCSYCANQKIKNSYPNAEAYTRYCTVDRALEALRHLKERYPAAEELIFNDNIIYPDKEWLRRFAERYAAEIGLPFTANTRPNLTDQEVVRLMKKAGCRTVCMGVESGDERIANRVLRRGQNNRIIRQAFRWFREAGIETVAYNIVGAPFETMETMLKTIRLNAEIGPTMISPFIYYPFPGTESYDLCAESGFLTEKHGVNNTDMVMIRQPQVGDAQVLFMHRYFRPMVRVFQGVRRLPRWLRKPVEESVAKVIVSAPLPWGGLAGLKEKYGSLRLRLAERKVGFSPLKSPRAGR